MREQYIEISKYGDKFYYKDRAMKILHREDGPAIEWADGGKEWFQNANRHRYNGPAVEYSNGDRHWFINGKLHREDGPAMEYADGEKCWYINGELHRTDGPAVEFGNGGRHWYINGKFLTEEEFIKRTAPEIVLTMDEIAAKFGIDVTKLKIKK